MTIDVRLLDHTSDPVRSLYIAYRTAYSALTPQTIAGRIESDRITRLSPHFGWMCDASSGNLR